MSDLKLGRFSLFLAVGGLIAVAATFFIPAILVLCALFTAIVLVTGFMSIRTRIARIGLMIALIALPGITALSYYRYEAVPPSRVIRGRGPVEVRFSPNGGCTEAIIAEINDAKRSIFVQAYNFTSAPIAKALVAAHQRGILVRVVLDKSQMTAKYTSATFLHNAGIETLIDTGHAIAHNKVIVIDSKTVLTGSMNFTKAGEYRNAENLLILNDGSLATAYMDNWNIHARHSFPYARTSQITDEEFPETTEGE